MSCMSEFYCTTLESILIEGKVNLKFNIGGVKFKTSSWYPSVYWKCLWWIWIIILNCGKSNKYASYTQLLESISVFLTSMWNRKWILKNKSLQIKLW